MCRMRVDTSRGFERGSGPVGDSIHCPDCLGGLRAASRTIHIP